MVIHKIPKVIAVLSILVGIMVIVGWFFDIGYLVSIFPGWPAMEFISAICFIFSGIIIFAIEREIHDRDELSSYIASLASLVIFLFVAILLASKVFGVAVGIEELFIKEKPLAVKSVVSGQPSLFSTINFLFISICGFILLVKPKKYILFFSIMGGIVSLVAVTAILGYVLDIPYMYSYMPGLSNGMSFMSSLLFLLIGISLALMGINHNNKKE